MEESIDEITDLYLQGNYTEALSLIDSKEFKSKTQIMKGMILIHLGSYREAEKLFDDLIKLPQSDCDRLKILTSKSFLLVQLGRNSEALDLLEKVDITNLDLGDEKDELFGDYYNLKGLVLKGLGQYDEAYRYFEKALSIRVQNKDEIGIAILYNNLGIILRNQGKYKKAIEYYNKCLNIDRKVGNKSDIANTLNNIGVVYDSLGEYKRALEYYYEAYDIYSTLGFVSDTASVENNIGVTLQSLGKFQDAVKHFTRSLEKRKQIEGYDFIRSNYGNLALIYYQMRNYSDAEKYLIPLIETFDKEPNDIELTDALLLLLKVYLATNRDTEPALAQLKRLAEENPNPTIQIKAKLGEGMQLRANRDLSSIVRAQQIFREILGMSDLDFQVKLSSLFNLSHLVLREYIILNEELVLNEFNGLLNKLDELVVMGSNPRLEIEVNLLRAHYSIIIGNLELYKSHITKSRELIQRNELWFYDNKINNFIKKMEKEIEEMKILEESGQQLRIKMKKSQLEDYLDQIIKLHG